MLSMCQVGADHCLPQLSISADNDEEEDDDAGVLGGGTRITGHSPGWTVFENLYLFNGTLFIVT